MRQAVMGNLNRASRNRRRHDEIDWNRTIKAKLDNISQLFQKSALATGASAALYGILSSALTKVDR